MDTSARQMIIACTLDENRSTQIGNIDLSKETSKMAEHLEKQKASPTGTLNSRVTTVGVNGQKNDDAKQQKPVFLEEKDRLKELNLPKANEWIDAFVDGKLKTLINQSHINSTHRIMKVKVISCHNLRKSDTSPSITPFVTLISPDMDRFERQYKFTTFQTKKANSLNPIFNQTFYMPLYPGDIEAFVAISKSGRPYNEKEKKDVEYKFTFRIMMSKWAITNHMVAACYGFQKWTFHRRI